MYTNTLSVENKVLMIVNKFFSRFIIHYERAQAPGNYCRKRFPYTFLFSFVFRFVHYFKFVLRFFFWLARTQQQNKAPFDYFLFEYFAQEDGFFFKPCLLCFCNLNIFLRTLLLFFWYMAFMTPLILPQ